MTMRMVIGFYQVETKEMRQFRNAMTGVWDLRPAPILRSRVHELAGEVDEGEAFFWWCAADAPEPSSGALGFARRAVYRTSKVPDGACCEVCGIALRDLQAEFTRTIKGAA